ncbi:MAG: thiamine phosphate synthase [Acidobacteriaceae bacterium]
MIRCAITSRRIFHGDEAAQRQALVQHAGQWAAAGVDFIQLREKDLPARELESLAKEVIGTVRAAGSTTRLLINSRADVAVAVAADGVHLSSAQGELTVTEVKRVFAAAGRPEPIVGVSCHTVAEIERARNAGASFAVFGPVFEKRVQAELVQQGTGLELLREACRVAGRMPVLALGGVTRENAAACLEAGAAGIAGIRLFRNL